MSFQKIVGILGTIVFVLSSVVHFLTYWENNLAEKYPVVWGLFPAAILIFGFTILTLYLKIGNRPGLKIFLNNTAALMPVWTWIVISIFFVYLIVSTAWFGPGLAVPTEFEGKYIINNHGKITEYTMYQVEQMKLNQLRTYSAFWMWLMLCSSLYLLTAKRNISD
jgi:hypothetical protein